MYSRGRCERKRATDDGRCAEAEPLDQPLLVIGLLEGAQGLLQVLDIRAVPHPQQLFLEGAEEPFDARGAYRLAGGLPRLALDLDSFKGGRSI